MPEPAAGAKGHSSPVPERIPLEARPGRGRPHLRPRNKAPAWAGGSAARPLPPSSRPVRLLPRSLTARSSPVWALALRPPPPCSRRTDGSRPAGPPVALARPHPGASLKRPRSPRAPGVPDARRIPYIATAPAKNRALRGRGRSPAPRRDSPPPLPAPRLQHAACRVPVTRSESPKRAERVSPAREQGWRRCLPRGPEHLPGSDPWRPGAGFKVDAEWEFTPAALRASVLQPLNRRLAWPTSEPPDASPVISVWE